MPSAIETIYSAGLDALANLFEVNMAPGTNVALLFGAAKDELLFRIQDFEVPPSEAGTYEINYGPWTFDRPNGKVNPTRTVTMNVRLDKKFELYQSFVNWKNSIQNEYTGVIGNVKDYLADISVYPITAIGASTDEYVTDGVGSGLIIEKAWVSSVGGISFDQSSGEPLVVPITFTFMKMNKDFNTILGSVEKLDIPPETA